MYNNALFQYELGGELFMTSEDCMSNNSELNCWVEQRKNLLDQMEQMNVTLKRLDYKIDRYETAVKTGELSWD